MAKQQIARAFRKLSDFFDPAPQMAPSPSRSEYRAHWNSLAKSESDAKMAVSGYVDETLYRETALATIATLRETVGINAEDTVLEIGAGVGRVGAVLAPLCREWIGTDVSDHMVDHMTRRLASNPNTRALTISGFDLKPI